MSKVRCVICKVPQSYWGLCPTCQRSYDRALQKVATIMGAIVWAAKRARRAERIAKKAEAEALNP
jgi:hypothetical protein